MVTAPAAVACVALHGTLREAREDPNTFAARVATLAEAGVVDALVDALEATEFEVAAEATKLGRELLGEKGAGEEAGFVPVTRDPAFHALRLGEDKRFVKAAVRLLRSTRLAGHAAGLLSAVAMQSNGTAGLHRVAKAGATIALGCVALPRCVADGALTKDFLDVESSANCALDVVALLRRLAMLPSEAAKLAAVDGAVKALKDVVDAGPPLRFPALDVLAEIACVGADARRRVIDSGAAEAALVLLREDASDEYATVAFDGTDGRIIPKAHALLLAHNLGSDTNWLADAAADHLVLECLLAGLRQAGHARAFAAGFLQQCGFVRSSDRLALWREKRVQEAAAAAGARALDEGDLDASLACVVLRILATDPLDNSEYRMAVADAGASRIVDAAKAPPLKDAPRVRVAQSALDILQIELGFDDVEGDVEMLAAARTLMAESALRARERGLALFAGDRLDVRAYDAETLHDYVGSVSDDAAATLEAASSRDGVDDLVRKLRADGVALKGDDADGATSRTGRQPHFMVPSRGL